MILFKRLLKGNNSTAAVLIEMVLIVVSVLVALAVGEWNEDRANNRLATEVLERIVTELNRNAAELEEVHKKHQALHDALKKELDKMEKNGKFDKIEIALNLQLGAFQRTAWQTALVTQAVRYIDFEVVQRLSAIYDIHELYKTQLNAALESLGSINFHLEDRVLNQLQGFLFNLTTTLQLESGLLNRCREFLKDQAPSAPLSAMANYPDPADNRVIFQNSTINALLEGLYDDDVTVGQVREYGNLGLGTFNTLDGEMVVLDDHVYKVKAVKGIGGNVSPVKDAEKTPFSVVTMFHPDKSVNTDKPMDLTELQTYLDTLRPSRNIFYAFRIEGRFGYIKTRSVPAQKRPYPRLSEVVKDQPEFEFRDIDGFLVGFWMPSFMKDINVPGYHLHFLSADKTKGGHLLACETGDIKIDIDYIYGFKMRLPGSREFLEMDLSGKTSELETVEQDRK